MIAMRLPPPYPSDLLHDRRGWLAWLRKRDVDRRAVTGVMARHVGEQHGITALATSSCYEMTELFDVHRDTVAPTRKQLDELARVRAFAVRTLEGTEVASSGDREFPAALQAHLRSVIPGVPWTVEPAAYWPIPKHLFFETCVPAPVDETTGMPMALQLYGRVVEHAGIRRDMPAWERFVREDEERVRRAQEANESLSIAAPIIVCIEVATYANVQRPNIGIPFYC